MTAYTAATSNEKDAVTATPEDAAAQVTIQVNGQAITNGAEVTWKSGSNTVQITVENGDSDKTYTVTVTYTPEAPTPPDTRLSALTVGSLALNPAFDPDTTAYTVETANTRNTVTATPADSEAAVVLTVDGEPVTNGSQVSWSDGDNALAVNVSVGDDAAAPHLVVGAPLLIQYLYIKHPAVPPVESCRAASFHTHPSPD